jgi:hypothetical protein
MTEEILTYEEVLALLSEQARAGKVAALVSLERALRPEGPGQEGHRCRARPDLGEGLRRPGFQTPALSKKQRPRLRTDGSRNRTAPRVGAGSGNP